MALSPGTNIGRYEIRAQRGMGKVYQARCLKINGLCYGASPDGQRLLINTRVHNTGSIPITIVLNWIAALKQ